MASQRLLPLIAHIQSGPRPAGRAQRDQERKCWRAGLQVLSQLPALQNSHGFLSRLEKIKNRAPQPKAINGLYSYIHYKRFVKRPCVEGVSASRGRPPNEEGRPECVQLLAIPQTLPPYVFSTVWNPSSSGLATEAASRRWLDADPEGPETSTGPRPSLPPILLECYQPPSKRSPHPRRAWTRFALERNLFGEWSLVRNVGTPSARRAQTRITLCAEPANHPRTPTAREAT